MLLKLYKAIVRPIFEYSASAHVNAATCHQLKLQAIQNAAIRTILGLLGYINTDLLHDASGLPKLHDHTTQFAQKRLAAIRVSSPIIEEVIDQFQDIAHLQTFFIL